MPRFKTVLYFIKLQLNSRVDANADAMGPVVQNIISLEAC